MNKTTEYEFTRKAVNPGEISFTFSRSDNGDNKTVHLDCFSNKKPYGHLHLGTIESLIKWLTEAKEWIKNENKV